MLELKELIASETRKIDQVMRQDLDRFSADHDQLLMSILDYGLFGGGKRVRPLLAVLSSKLAGCRDERVYELGIAFEYLHVATLFHDDVIDNASTRRNRSSVNEKFGIVGAILAGDFLHAHSMAIIGRYAGTEGLSLFTSATCGMADGEFVQLRNIGNLAQTEDDYFKVVMGKTALLIGAACQIGGRFGGADQNQAAALSEYGLKLGCAFQIVDDLLDYTGDPSSTGKRVGNDLIEGKVTLPLILALKDADKRDKSWLYEVFQNERSRSEQTAEVIDFISRYDGFMRARKQAEKIITEALARLDCFIRPEDNEILVIFKALAAYVLTREK